MNNNRIAIATVAIGVIIFAIIAFTKDNTQSTTITTSSKTTNSSIPTNDSKSYSSSVSYEVPRGSENISVKVMLLNNKISSISTTHSEDDRHSREYQLSFEAAYKNMVLGKDINSITLSRVGGASLTTEAFNQAIAQIAAKVS